jgi:hypothetical protein
MNITDDPMPGVAPPGSRFYALLCQKDGKIVLHEAWPIYRRDHAIANAKAVAAEGGYASVVVIDATTIYRVWDRDQLRDVA